MAQPATTALKTPRLRDNIDALSRRSRAEAEDAPLGHRVAMRLTAIAGSMTFVLVQAVFYGLWVLANTAGLPGLPQFDEGLAVLAVTAALESIFLALFVLVSQNRMIETAARNADLDLHVSLLAEHELTRLTELVERIAVRLDVDTADLALGEIKEEVEPNAVLDAIEERRP